MNWLAKRIAVLIWVHVSNEIERARASERGRVLAKKRWDDNGGRELVTPESTQAEDESLVEFNRRRRGF